MMARKTEIAMGDCIINDLERLGEEWEKMTDRMNWRRMTGKVERENREEKR